ncbi:hypothetical protein ACRRTK_018581 [Alexandromys fortis]
MQSMETAVRSDVHTSRNSENWTASSLFTSSLPQPITVRTPIPTFTPSRGISTMVQQAHRPAPCPGAAMVPFTNSKVCDTQVCVGDGAP